eukprot:628322-Lingulodinium_polyedra.AAC.1
MRGRATLCWARAANMIVAQTRRAVAIDPIHANQNECVSRTKGRMTAATSSPPPMIGSRCGRTCARPHAPSV